MTLIGTLANGDIKGKKAVSKWLKMCTLGGAMTSQIYCSVVAAVNRNPSLKASLLMMRMRMNDDVCKGEVDMSFITIIHTSFRSSHLI